MQQDMCFWSVFIKQKDYREYKREQILSCPRVCIQIQKQSKENITAGFAQISSLNSCYTQCVPFVVVYGNNHLRKQCCWAFVNIFSFGANSMNHYIYKVALKACYELKVAQCIIRHFGDYSLYLKVSEQGNGLYFKIMIEDSNKQVITTPRMWLFLCI